MERSPPTINTATKWRPSPRRSGRGSTVEVTFAVFLKPCAGTSGIASLLIRIAKIESKILRHFGSGAGGFFEGYIADVEGTFETLDAFKEAFYGGHLDAGIAGAVGGGVETHVGCPFLQTSSRHLPRIVGRLSR